MPQRLVCSAPDTISFAAYELPKVLKPGEIRVRNTHGAEKHGTQMACLHGYASQRGQWDGQRQIFIPNAPGTPGTPGRPGAAGVTYPVGLGNMQVGVVEEIGAEVKDLKAGDRVAYFGCFAPTAVTGADGAWKLERDTCWKSATCFDPAAFALGAVRDGNVRVGDAVAVSSLGAIGLMAVQLAKHAGAYPIIAIDPLAHRRQVATELGADLVLDPRGCDVGAAVRQATQGRGADVVIEYSGAMEAIQAALRGVAFGGTVVAGAFPSPMKAGLDLGAEAHLNRPNIVFSRACSDPNRDHPRWTWDRIGATVRRMILAGQLDGSKVVSPVLKFDHTLSEQYDAIISQPQKGIKLGVEY
jgi:threonine dehydrogenase-like Zn-dependent dehydrogenase